MPDPILLFTTTLLALGLAWWLFRPGRGRFWQWRRMRLMAGRMLTEDALKHIHRCERQGHTPTIESLAGALETPGNEIARLLDQMATNGLVTVNSDGFHLTPAGREYALHIIRAHRLWERYLADKTGFNEAEWHELAERQEHLLDPAGADALASQLGNPIYDPHGDPIPTADGELVAHGGIPLSGAPLDTPLQIVHLEDEPEAIFAQLVAEGLHPGLPIRLLERTPQRLRFWANEDEHLLAPIVAANISVVPLPADVKLDPAGVEPLANLQPGDTARVVSLSPALRGSERRRFMDLGILPGTQLTAELVSAGGDPTAYLVRGALIALRREQAQHIKVRRQAETEAAPPANGTPPSE